MVDDSAGNDIHSIVKKFSASSKISYYHNEKNIGGKDPSANWNECLKYAKGEFICILCDDDLYAPSFVCTMVELVNKYPECNAFRCGVSEIDEGGHVTNLFPLAPEYEDICEYIWHLHSGNNRQTMSEWMLRKAALLKVNGYVPCPMAWGSDCATVFTVAEYGGVVSSALRLMYFRNSGQNISGREKSYIPEKICGWYRQCDLAHGIVARSNNAYKEIILHEIGNDRKRWRKFLIKNASIKELTIMIRSKNIYKLNIGAYINGVVRNVLRFLGLRKK